MRMATSSSTRPGHGASRIAAIGRHPKPSTKTEVSGLARHARFTLRCRHRQPAPACPFGAITGSDHTHSITSSARPRRGNTYSKSARGHEVCSQYHLGREFQGKIARWYSMQNSVHEISCAVRTPTQVNTITDQPASDDMFAISIHGWEPLGSDWRFWRII